MLSKILATVLICTLGIVVVLTAQELEFTPSHALSKELNCAACHECINPTEDSPCLRLGPHLFFDQGKELLPEQLPPDTVIINTVEGLYDAVVFQHRDHMHMAERIEDCAECHHYHPPDKPKLRCGECHNPNTIRHDLDMISLNGAYHRKCLSCHVEWGKTTNCEVCHAAKDPEHSKKLAQHLSKFREVKQPNIKVFQTRYFIGPKVNFPHDFHTKQKNVKCADCHIKQPCVACHYQEERPSWINPLARTGVHGTCRLCHDVMTQGACDKCHKSPATPGLLTNSN